MLMPAQALKQKARLSTCRADVNVNAVRLRHDGSSRPCAEVCTTDVWNVTEVHVYHLYGTCLEPRGKSIRVPLHDRPSCTSIPKRCLRLAVAS